jgi:hypothetical protein
VLLEPHLFAWKRDIAFSQSNLPYSSLVFSGWRVSQFSGTKLVQGHGQGINKTHPVGLLRYVPELFQLQAE